jgi:hypothetical protein
MAAPHGGGGRTSPLKTNATSFIASFSSDDLQPKIRNNNVVEIPLAVRSCEDADNASTAGDDKENASVKTSGKATVVTAAAAGEPDQPLPRKKLLTVTMRVNRQCCTTPTPYRDKSVQRDGGGGHSGQQQPRQENKLRECTPWATSQKQPTVAATPKTVGALPHHDGIGFTGERENEVKQEDATTPFAVRLKKKTTLPEQRDEQPRQRQKQHQHQLPRRPQGGRHHTHAATDAPPPRCSGSQTRAETAAAAAKYASSARAAAELQFAKEAAEWRAENNTRKAAEGLTCLLFNPPIDGFKSSDLQQQRRQQQQQLLQHSPARGALSELVNAAAAMEVIAVAPSLISSCDMERSIGGDQDASLDEVVTILTYLGGGKSYTTNASVGKRKRSAGRTLSRIHGKGLVRAGGSLKWRNVAECGDTRTDGSLNKLNVAELGQTAERVTGDALVAIAAEAHRAARITQLEQELEVSTTSEGYRLSFSYFVNCQSRPLENAPFCI